MRQQESVPMPQLPSYQRRGNLTLCTLLAKYMLDKGYTDIPLIFLDSHGVTKAVWDAKGYADKLDKCQSDDKAFEQMSLQETTILAPLDAGGSLEEATGNFLVDTMTDPAACLFVFESGNSLAMVGSSGNYYVIDVANNLFFAISSPEYIVSEYAEQYGGSGEFVAFTLSPKVVVSEPDEDASIVVSEPIQEEEAVEPKPKKPRTVRKKRTVKPPKEKEEATEPMELEQSISLPLAEVQEEIVI